MEPPQDTADVCVKAMSENTVLTYRLLRTDYADVNLDGKDKPRPSFSLIVVESRRGDEARSRLVFDLSPTYETANALLDALAGGTVPIEALDEILSEHL